MLSKKRNVSSRGGQRRTPSPVSPILLPRSALAGQPPSLQLRRYGETANDVEAVVLQGGYIPRVIATPPPPPDSNDTDNSLQDYVKRGLRRKRQGRHFASTPVADEITESDTESTSELSSFVEQPLSPPRTRPGQRDVIPVVSPSQPRTPVPTPRDKSREEDNVLQDRLALLEMQVHDLHSVNQQLEGRISQFQQNESVDSGINFQEDHTDDGRSRKVSQRGSQTTPRRLQDQGQGMTPRQPTPRQPTPTPSRSAALPLISPMGSVGMATDRLPILESTIQRLSSQLELYMRLVEEYRKSYGPLQQDATGTLPNEGITPSWLINTQYLAPLFKAYDELFNRRQLDNKKIQTELDEMESRFQEIIKENERLHLKLEHSDNGPANMTEWRQLKEQCNLVLEENQLLLQQLDHLKKRHKDEQRELFIQVKEKSDEVRSLQQENSEHRTQVENIKKSALNFKRHHEEIIVNSQSTVKMEEHLTFINEVKRLHEEERHKLERTMTNQRNKIQALAQERKQLLQDIEDLKQECHHLEEERRRTDKLFRKGQQKLTITQRLLADQESQKEASEHYLQRMIRMAEKTVVERDSFAKAAQDSALQKDVALKKFLNGQEDRKKMENQMQSLRANLADKLRNAAERLQEQDDSLERMKEEHEQDLRQLQKMLQQRERLIQAMSGEKEQTEEDMDRLYSIVRTENQQMTTEMRLLARRMTHHPRLRDLVESDEDGEHF